MTRSERDRRLQECINTGKPDYLLARHLCRLIRLNRQVERNAFESIRKYISDPGWHPWWKRKILMWAFKRMFPHYLDFNPNHRRPS